MQTGRYFSMSRRKKRYNIIILAHDFNNGAVMNKLIKYDNMLYSP